MICCMLRSSNLINASISIATYHEYILEGIYSLRLGLLAMRAARVEDQDTDPSGAGVVANLHFRYSFLMNCMALESAANALLIDVDPSGGAYKDYERKPLIEKFKHYCKLKSRDLDSSDEQLERIKRLIESRHEFVHPKPRKGACTDDGEVSENVGEGKDIPDHYYPKYFGLIGEQQALRALQDTVAFLSWLCFDVCGLRIEEGAYALGLGSFGSTADLDFVSEENNLELDTRTFGRKQ